MAKSKCQYQNVRVLSSLYLCPFFPPMSPPTLLLPVIYFLLARTYNVQVRQLRTRWNGMVFTNVPKIYKTQMPGIVKTSGFTGPPCRYHM